MEDLRYPIGPFVRPTSWTASDRSAAVDDIAVAPLRLREAVSPLSDGQLDTPYRPEGWTVRQVVHHLPDSHLNAYVRLKLTLTEEVPTIRTYEEARWARLPDASAPVDMSLDLLDRIHERWVYLLRRLGDGDWARKLRHPELGEMDLDELLAHYAWHGKHHVAHVTSLIARKGWA